MRYALMQSRGKMSYRDYLKMLADRQEITCVKTPVSKILEAAGILKKLEPKPTLFEAIKESNFSVAGNLFCGKQDFARYFNIQPEQIIPFLTTAIEQRSPCEIVSEAPCQQVIHTNPDLDLLPILKYCQGDGGNYITAGVVVSRHPKHGQNLDFHRCMQFSKNELAMRIVRSRHFDAYLQDQKQLDIALCIGNAPNVLAAAAISVEIGVDELEIANALQPLKLVHAKTVHVFIPAESEFVLEGTVYLDKKHAEGPFVDLTGTQDIVRQEPVFVVKTITHRTDAIWQALLPGSLEHKLLMGMPREPTIFKKVNEVVKCLDVYVNPGGCSWLHTIIQIDKQNEDDGKLAIQAAFAGHRSCKHVYVVDKDIDIYNPLEVEWAMATRFQGDHDMIIMKKEQGSSLDPSAEPVTHLTTKIGFDLTKPLRAQGKNYENIPYPEVDLSRYGLK